MRTVVTALITGFAFALPAAAEQFESGDWAATKTGDSCEVYTVRAAKNTSGRLVFSFKNQGFDAGFSYEYEPWPGETEAPWSKDDLAVLELDEEESWLADEMAPYQNTKGHGVSITAGFVGDVISAFGSTQRTVGIVMDRQAQGEKALYGLFSIAGFSDSMGKASQWCQFNPTELPTS